MTPPVGVLEHDRGALSDRVLGDFTLRELVGAGAMGDVYLAEQQGLRREAVVKVLRSEGGSRRRVEARVEEFLREAKLASQLDHPYAAHVYAFGAEADGVCWIAMELVRGATLRAMLEAQGPIPLERFVPLLERICEVVHTAHEQGIIHRDLKPDNVMVISRAGRLLPKLLDFGIAHAVLGEQPSATEATGVRGSPSYLAPELWLDPRAASAASDQYALGALAYEALTGKLAFSGKSTMEIARAHARPVQRTLGPGLPPALDAVVDRALSRRAADRFHNALELAQAFRDASGIGVSALELPQLDQELRLRFLAHAPQPIADAIAAYDAAKNAHQAREALRALARIVGWYVALLALACRTRIGSGPAADPDATRALITDLRRHGLTPAGWVALARQLTRPFAAAPDTYPIPELVLLLHPRAGADVFAAIHQGSLAESLPDTSEDAAAQAIARELPQVTALLRASAFLLEYLLVVSRGGRGEAWMGTRGNKRIVPLARDVPEGRVVLANDTGAPLLALWPLVQIAVAVPGHGEQLFLLSGPGRQGARLVSALQGFAHHDAAVWDWFRDELFERVDAADAVAPGNPYRGLSSYRPDDAAWFFGRERESEAVVNRLRLEPFVAVVGPSGVGKSSFVHAGVAPQLGWRVISMRPGRSPLAQLAAQLAAADLDAGDLAADEPGAIAERLRRAAAAVGGLLLVVDQFEELLTLGSSTAERDRFVRILLAAASASDGQLGAVITLRDDFLIRIEQLPGLGPALARGIQLLGPLGVDALARILVEPARRAGFEFEDPALPARMVEAVAGESAAVALISFTAARLWELRDRHFHQLSTKAYDAIGGVTGALARHADETVDAMPAAERQLVRRAFRHLVTFEGTRAVLEREELHHLLGGGAESERLIERLVEARLLISSENDRGTAVIEIVHEALIREWPRLVEWRREDSFGSRFHEQLRSAARQWDDRGRPRGLVWHGDEVAEYQLWRKRHAPSLTPLEAAFGAASIADAARGRRLRRVFAAAAIVITAVFVIALSRANVAANRSKREAERLLRDSLMEQGRLRVLEGDKLGSLAPLAAAYQMGARGAPTRLLLEAAAHPARASVATLAGHTDKLWDIAFSPDGKWVATGGADHTVRLWDAATGTPRAVIPHGSRVYAVGFSPDSRYLASGGSDRRVIVWDLAANKQLLALSTGAAVRRVSFGRDPTLVLTSSAEQVARLWQLPSGEPAGELGGHDRLSGGVFCEGGGCIVTWDSVGVMIWDAAGRKLVARHEEADIATVVVSKSGSLIALGTVRGELVLLRRDGSLIARRAAHDDTLWDLAISPDETTIVSASHDRTARLWSATGEPRGVLGGHRANVAQVRFTPAGDRIVTTSADYTARLWSASGMLLGEMIGHTNLILRAEISPDGTRLGTASWDGTARLWDLSRAAEMRLITVGLDDAPPVAAFDPADARLAIARAEGTLSVVDLATGKEVCAASAGQGIQAIAWASEHELAVHRGEEYAIELRDARGCAVTGTLQHPAPIAAMAVGGGRLVTAAGGVVRVWRGGRMETSFSGYLGGVWKVGIDGDEVYALTLSPNSVVIDEIADPARRRSFEAGPQPVNHVYIDRKQGRIYGASIDQILYVWDAATGGLIRKLSGTGPMSKSRISADGTLVVGAGGLSPTVWDVKTGAVVAQLEGHSSLVTDGAFLDDRIFLTLSHSGTAVVWDLNRARPLMRLGGVQAMVPSNDGRSFALLGKGGTRVWTPRTPVPDPDALRAWARKR